ncbi:MAG: GNAT superfamily N-acetyltransferase [Candidatus Endobugula sp.]|jgi:GNAT superfamily N-acetyltransferase
MILKGSVKTVPLGDTLLCVRQKALWPDKPLSFSSVDGDDDAQHFGYYAQEQLISVASIYSDKTQVRLRKFATLPSFQRCGVGSLLLTHIIEEVKTSGAHYFWCDARKNATGFHEKFGMNKESVIFYKSGIAYYKMSKIFS